MFIGSESYKNNFLNEENGREKFEFSMAFNCSCNMNDWIISLSGDEWNFNQIDNEQETMYSSAPGALGGKCSVITSIGCGGLVFDIGEGTGMPDACGVRVW